MAHVEFRLLDCAVKIPSAAQELNHAAVSMRSECIRVRRDRKSTRLNSSHSQISYAVFCLKKKNECADRALLGAGTERVARAGDLDDDPSTRHRFARVQARRPQGAAVALPCRQILLEVVLE